MAVDLAALETSLQIETDWLSSVLAGLDAPQWEQPTPAAGWAVRDQVSHLAYFDDAVTRALRDPEAFARERDAAFADVDAYTESIARANRARTPEDLLAWFRSARSTMLDALRAAAPAARVPWFGPPMSVASALTARVMETFAHGQDIADALETEHPPSVALRDIAHLGVRTFGFAFTVHGIEVPESVPTVVLRGPGGDHWTWAGSDERVDGSARDFCLLVTQRRHRADTDLVATGATADRWLDLAQCFAGPPGRGRAPIG